ncbi:MAG: cell wall metabolism sensor histidine kinase WalK [Chlorobiaceae bacterium]|nr:cell wall metabolism sensor histidine kinase WalK [Chlorobiaceae bacterium]
MRARISYRLGAIFGLIVFFSLAFSYVYQGRQLRQLFIAGVRNDLMRELRLNGQMLEDRPAAWSDNHLSDQWADRVGSALDVRVTIIDLNGIVIGDSYVDAGKLPFLQNHAGRPEITAAIAGGYGESIRYSETAREEMLYMAMPVGVPTRWGVVRFAKPLHDIRMLEDEVRKGIEGGLFWALLLGLTAGIFSAVYLSRPLERIADSADRFLHGESGIRMPVRRRDEIGRLSLAFNYMADEIVRMSRQEEWLREVLSSIREAIIVTNADGQIVLVNPAASRLFPIEGAMNRAMPVKQIADRGVRELLEQVLASGNRTFREEVTARTSKGDRVLKVSAVPVMQGERFDGTVFVINDVTRLRNLERMRRDFVSSVSHELRTPLASIKGYTETLLDGAMNDPETATAFLRIILQESEQLTALVNDVLDLSRIESGRIIYTFGPVDVRRQLEKTVAVFEPAAWKKGVRIELAIPDGLPPVKADSGYFDVVMRNLVDNALKYVDEKSGVVRIRAFPSSGGISIEVEDNGIGIPQTDLDRIFERFYRVDKARSRQLGGTGLGLSIVKHIVLAHHGDIQVRSRVNRGSVFTVTLPLFRENSAN